MADTMISANTLGERAHEIYERDLRDQVETEENIGKILVLDVESGNYEIDENGLTANRRLRDRHPEINPRFLFAFRIGYDAVYGIGATITRTPGR